MNARLAEAIRYFTREKGIMDALTVVCGKGERTETAWDGREIGPGTLYDLASVTKILTGLCLMRLWEDGELDPRGRVSAYCPEFENLNTVTVEQIAAFQVSLQTPERLDAQESREAARAALFGTRNAGTTGRRAYSDIPAMVLKYVIERVSGKPMYECVKEIVLDPAGMRETFAKVPEERIPDCLLYGPEYRIEGEKWICREGTRGVPHDPKAAILQGTTGDLCGHAGMYSTAGDMEKLARAVLDGKIVKPETLEKIAVNRTGRERADGGYTQYLGYMCYLKHPDQYFSEIPESMSHRAFGIGGFTGNHFSVDPGTGRFTIFLGNRVRDRLTVLLPPEGKTREDYGLCADGSGKIRWTDGTEHYSSVDYVHQKDEHLHRVIDQILG